MRDAAYRRIDEAPRKETKWKLPMLDLDAVFDDDRLPGRSRGAGDSADASAVANRLLESSLAELGPMIESESGYLTPEQMPAQWREYYEERAAIREYDGCQLREHAEADALSETIQAMRREEKTNKLA